MRTDEIRSLFLEFFRSKGHEIVPSDSLVPKDDPTLLFTGAGMNQFKEKFLGRNVTYTRAASSQKCLRTGDLENVGRTAGHHTFFEMLGNFSFGDYFKQEAIQWAWEFFTIVLKIPSDRLWVSVYNDDDEAYNIWEKKIKVPAYKIMKFGAKENFWPSEAPTKGPNGPCGPCSEIFYDYGSGVGCQKETCTPACDCGRFVEVWNLVFTQFDRQPDGSLKPLPKKNIDTGMGIERIASVLQGVRTNFDIDIFVPIVKEIETLAGRHDFRQAKTITCDAQNLRFRINAMADHVRAVVFCIADGVMPSNEERGYVVRKLIRRAMLHGREIGIKEPALYKLVSVIADVMKAPYPELRVRRDDIAQIVKREEENFLFILQNHLPKVEAAFEDFRRTEAPDRLAEIAFNFYDTYGMPYEMLEDIAERYGLKIDRNAFDRFLDKQRELSRSRTKIKGEIFSETFAKKVEALRLKTEFVGYEKTHAEAKVLAVLEDGEVILDKTPFYGESGGQVGDRGRIETSSGAMEVEDAKKIGDTIVHIGSMLKGTIAVGEIAKVSIDESARNKIMANHTATHLLQAALKKVLGDHVRQTGSLVDSQHLRFDFTHMKKMNERELSRVEEIVNDNIKKAIPVKKEIKDIETARREGATALFGEKYDNMVRVVTVEGVSKELCGGTHLDNTKDIGIFKITSESSIASGVRRIEAVTGRAAEEWLEGRKRAAEAKKKAEAHKEEEKKFYAKRLEEEAERIELFLSRAKNVADTKVIIENIGDISIDGLRALADRIRQREKDAIVLLGTRLADKVSFVVSVPEKAVKKGISANSIAKEAAVILDGSGGGRDNFAQGGGKAAARLEEAFNKALHTIRERLG
ncbi:MAG: alanine--tRNA ligase [Candidatus Omnitrophica bacterium]|nr:alanine--tRNA ligase [Candidatus Omnitrophota bacterium]